MALIVAFTLGLVAGVAVAVAALVVYVLASARSLPEFSDPSDKE